MALEGIAPGGQRRESVEINLDGIEAAVLATDQ
jgi:hypothetical protein